MKMNPIKRRRVMTRAAYWIDLLESRLLLSLSSTVFGNPETTQGNSWTYSITSTVNSNTGTVTTTVGAPTTDQGQPAIEFDTNTTGASTKSGNTVTTSSVNYLAQTAAGFVSYEQNNRQYLNGSLNQTDADAYATPLVGLPATLDAGTPVTETDTEYETDTDSTGTITQYTDNDTNVFTLVSDSTQSITVPAGTFDCYQVDESLTTVTTQNGTTSSSTSTSNEVLYLAQGVGEVELTNTPGGGSTTVTQALTSFTGADRLVFAPTQLPNVQAGDPIQPAFTVSVDDSAGNVVTDASGTVTLTPAGVNAANPITGNTATLVNGVATFSNVVLTKAGVYQLQASDTAGDAVATSSKFGVGGDQLKFLKSPKDSDPGQPLTMTIEALDSHGHLDTAFTDTASLGLNVVTGNTTMATLSGMTTLTFVSGKATVPAAAGPSINAPGKYTLTVTAQASGSTDYTVAAATSDAFTILGPHLKISSQPTKVDVLDPVLLTVQLLDSKNKVITTENTAQVQITLNPNNVAGSTLVGTTTATFVNGRATFGKTGGFSFNAAGSFTVTATETGTDTAGLTTAAQSKPITTNGLHYEIFLGDPDFPTQALTPDILPSSLNNSLVVDLYGHDGKAVTSVGTFPNPSLALNAITGSGTLTNGPVTVKRPSGDADQNLLLQNVFISAAGTYTFTITATDVASEIVPASAIVPFTTKSFRIVSDKLISTVQANVTVGATFTARVTILFDLTGKLKFTADPSVGIEYDLVVVSGGLTVYGMDATLTGDTVSALDDVAGTYAGSDVNLRIDAPGVYELKATEVQSAVGSPFNAATATPVATMPTITSKKFNILSARLVITTPPPKSLYNGSIFSMTATLEDTHGNVLSYFGSSADADAVAVNLSEDTLSGSFVNQLAGTVLGIVVNGVATFTDLSFMKPGKYKILADVEELDNLHDFVSLDMPIVTESLPIVVSGS